MQVGCSYAIIENNVIKNCYKVNGNHNDLIQGMRNSPGYGLQIRGNILFSYTDVNQLFKGACQGIGLFDAMKNDYIVENNLVVTDHANGLTLIKATNCKVINNTVVDPNIDIPGPSWIQISGEGSEGNIVRNNICNSLNITSFIGIVENNITIGLSQYNTYFVDYENFDFHSKLGSPAINAGIAGDVPAEDIEGNSRPQYGYYDIGAFEYAGPFVRVDDITLSSRTLDLTTGEMTNLATLIEPTEAINKNISWNSNDTSVAVIDDGKVIAMSQGTAAITVTTEDGGITDECIVTVTEPSGDYNLALYRPVAVTDVYLDTPAANLVNGDENDEGRWSAEGLPQSAVVDLGGDCNISSIQVYTYKKRAYQYIIEASSDGNTYTTIVDRSSNTDGSQPIADNISGTARYIKLTVSGAAKYTGSWVSINELVVIGHHISDSNPVTNIETKRVDSQFKLEVWPNPVPTGHQITIDLNNYNLNKGITVCISDLSRKIVFISEAVKIPSGKIILNQNMSKGLYILNVTSGDISLKRKLVIE